MLMFLGYWLPMIILIGGLIVFKKLFVKCSKTSDFYIRKTNQEPITFPIWKYIIYFCSAFTPGLNWGVCIYLLIMGITGDYFCPYSWTGRDYWYEIPEAKIDTFLEKIGKKVEKILNNKWFMNVCVPFVYLYKIMTKNV